MTFMFFGKFQTASTEDILVPGGGRIQRTFQKGRKERGEANQILLW